MIVPSLAPLAGRFVDETVALRIAGCVIVVLLAPSRSTTSVV